MKTHYWTRSIILSLCLLMAVSSLGAPYHGTEMLLQQPNGSQVKVKIWGDEYYQRIESLDGYTLIRDNNGWICFAFLSPSKKELLSTGIKYRGKAFLEEKRLFISQKSSVKFPELQKGIDLDREGILKIRNEMYTKLHKNTEKKKSKDTPSANKRIANGNVKGLTLLIDFTDQTASVEKRQIENFFNQAGYGENGNNGSVRDYFLDVSGGKLIYDNLVVGYYRAKMPKSYYDENSYYGKTSELIEEALTWLDQQGFDFTSLTLDEYNAIKAINIFYAGYPTQGWSKGLWPHQGYFNFTADGVRTGLYQMTNIGLYPTLATTCHENGHMIMGWPDLYDYGYSGSSAGLGNYCLMAYQGSSLNPLPPNAYLRMNAGWENVTVINSLASTVSLTSNSLQSLMYENPEKPSEFFMIESRTRAGRNESLPDQGLMIWHVDEYGSNENQEMSQQSHYMVSLEQADGQFDLEMNNNYGYVGDLFKAGYKEKFNDYTLPDAKWWDGSRSQLSISNISAVGNTMSLKLGGNYSLIAPTNLTDSYTERKVKLNWVDNSSDESGFIIERKGYYSGFTYIATVGPNVTTFTDDSPNLYSDIEYTYRVYAYNATGGSPYSNETSIVIPRLSVLPFLGSPIVVPGQFEAEYFDNGLEAGYHDSDKVNQGGQFRTDVAVDIEYCSEGGYNIGWIQTEEWLKYSLNVSTSGDYEIKVRVAAIVSDGKFLLEFNGSNELGYWDVPKTQGWQDYITITKTVHLDAGQQVMKFLAIQGGFNLNYFSIEKVSTSTENLLVNSGFENGTNYWVNNWSAITSDITQFSEGVKSLKVTNRRESWAGPQQDIKETLNINGPGTYNLAGWVKKEAGSGNAGIFIKLKYGGQWYYYGVNGNCNENWAKIEGKVCLHWEGALEEAYFYVQETSGTGSFYLDNCLLSIENLIVNSGFENGSTEWMANFCSIAPQVTQKRSGQYGLNILERSAAWSGPQQDIKGILTVQGPGTYAISGWFKKVNASNDQGKVTIKLKYGNTWYYYNVSGEFNTTSWTKIAGIVNLSWASELQEAYFFVETLNTNENFNVDDCLLSKVSGPYTPPLAPQVVLKTNAHINVFPNPASSIMNVVIDNYKENKEGKIRLRDDKGRVRVEEKFSGRSSSINLDPSLFGVFLLEVETPLGKTIKKVVIQ